METSSQQATILRLKAIKNRKQGREAETAPVPAVRLEAPPSLPGEITVAYLRRLKESGKYSPGFWKGLTSPSGPEWVDRGGHWLNLSPQGSDAWHALRRDMLTGSNIGAAVGHSRFSRPLEVALDITGVQRKDFSTESQRVMSQGTVREPLARELYVKKMGVEVVEVGLAVPKWDPRIGVSLDGEVVGRPGIIEIKSPDRGIYQPLLAHEKRLAAGWTPPRFYHQHIWDSHYDQMQAGMAVTAKEWCDYVVYDGNDGRLFVDRVEFNREYWDEELWPAILRFLEDLLEPLIWGRENGFPRML